MLPYGSSPRVRGKRVCKLVEALDAGLIPACAGKTYPACQRERASRAHPRVCGENGDSLLEKVASAGSSPRVRGKPVLHAVQSSGERLIPACAGKTLPLLRTPRKEPAHPRVCGENTARPIPIGSGEGSSPRVRGKPRIRAWKLPAPRLIPACAGKTFTTPCGRVRPWAHPRVCGENM